MWAVYGDLGLGVDAFRSVAPSIPVLAEEVTEGVYDGIVHGEIACSLCWPPAYSVSVLAFAASVCPGLDRRVCYNVVPGASRGDPFAEDARQRKHCSTHTLLALNVQRVFFLAVLAVFVMCV